MQGKRMLRTNTDRMIAGVAGGLSTYFNIDPVFIRLAFVILALFNGFGALLYLAMWVLLPNENSTASDTRSHIQENINEMQESAERLIDRVRSAFQR